MLSSSLLLATAFCFLLSAFRFRFPDPEPEPDPEPLSVSVAVPVPVPVSRWGSGSKWLASGLLACLSVCMSAGQSAGQPSKGGGCCCRHPRHPRLLPPRQGRDRERRGSSAAGVRWDGWIGGCGQVSGCVRGLEVLCV